MPSITSVLVSRFMLDLQRARHESQNFNGDRPTLIFSSSSDSASISFTNRVIASIGEMLAGDLDVGSPNAHAPDDMELNMADWK